VKNDLIVWDDAPMPKLPELYCGIFVREGGNRQAFEDLADHLAELRVEPHVPEEQQSSTMVRASKAG
jgi:hypothetical protein